MTNINKSWQPVVTLAIFTSGIMAFGCSTDSTSPGERDLNKLDEPASNDTGDEDSERTEDTDSDPIPDGGFFTEVGICGDGELTDDEACDDGNTENEDGCAAD